MSMDHRGGFHGYRKQQLLPKSSSNSEIRVAASEMSPGLQTADMNHISPTRSNGRIAPHEMMMNHNNGNMNGHSNSNNNSHSAVAAAMEQDGNNNNNNSNNECTVREQDRFMPIANVIRIMRKILPQHAKISDDAKETIQECVSEYISFITGEANERCQREQRKTITAEDVLWAMSKLGFDDYIEPLTLYLHRYRELEGDRGSIRTCEPLLKLSRASSSAMDHYAAAYGPVFHIGPPGYYGPPSSSVNGYLKDPSSAAASSNGSDAAGPSHPPAATSHHVTSFEPYGQHK